MGGKTKTSQRTKNNARPSSSGRSAELLSNASLLDPTMLSGPKMMSAFFPSLATPALDQGLPPELSICIKKLNKKDPVTKVKALQELSELASNSKVDDVVLTLPSWTHYYRILSVDTDCKVREMTQLCHGSITVACGRRAAPFLRQLVPAWLPAQHDDHAPAAAQAQASLKALFPENKLPEVISFCKAEVMAHLKDSLVGNAQKTLMKPAEDPDERSRQLQRLATSSLQGLQYFSQKLPSTHDEWLWAELTPLLGAPAYWAHASHTDHNLRLADLIVQAAWFAATARIVERFASTFAERFGAKLVKIVLAAAHDTQSLPAHQIWGCLLQFMHSVPEWHKYLDKKDLLTKRILNILEKGGWGDAKRMTEMFLPLLAHLPPDMLTKEFYEAFFDSFFKGLEKKSVLISKSERQYWITSLAECLRYLSIQQNDFVLEVTTSVHRNWLEIVLSTEREGQLKTNLIKHSATSMVALLKYWLKQSKEANGDKYDQLIRNFWQNICSTVLTQVDKPEVEIAKVIDGHIQLLQTLKQAFLNESKKVQSIKFDGDTPTKAEVKAPTEEIDAVSLERYNHNLDEVIEKVCCHYFEYSDKNDLSDPVLLPLVTILNEFNSKNLFLALARYFSATSVYDFYEKVLMKWMLRDTMRSKTMVDIVFILLKHLSEEEQDAVLNSFDKLGTGTFEWCLGAALCHSAWSIAAARRWLQSAAVTHALLALTRRLLRQRCANARHLLLVCLSTDGRGEMLISEDTASQIADVVSDALSEWLDNEKTARSEQDIEHVSYVAAHFCTALASKSRAATKLVVQLLRLVLYVPRGDPALSVNGWSEARSAAHDGLAGLPPAARAPAAALVTQRLATLEEINVPYIEHMTSLCPYLLSGCSSPEDVKEVIELNRLLLHFKLELELEVCALRHDCVVGRFNCPFDDDNDIIKAVVQDANNDDPIELTKEDLIRNMNTVLFRALYLKAILLHANTDDDDEKSEDNSWCDLVLNNEFVQREFHELLRECMVVNSLDEAYGFWVHHNIIKDAKAKLYSIVDEIIAATAEKTRADILSRLLEYAAEEGYYWACARRFYEVKVEGGITNICNLDANPCKVDKTDPKTTDNSEDTKADSDDDDETIMEDLQKDYEKVLTMPDENDEYFERMVQGKGYYHCLQANTQWTKDAEARLHYLYSVAVRSVIAGVPGVDDAFTRTAVGDAKFVNIDAFVDLYHRLDPNLLGEKDILTMSWGAVVAEVAIIDVVAGALRRAGWQAPPHHWDFATVTLCALSANVGRARAHCHTTKVAMLARATFRLYMVVQHFISKYKSRCLKQQPAAHIANLPAEWRDVFAVVLHRDYHQMAVAMMEEPPKITYNSSRVLTGLARAIRVADWTLIDAAHRNSSLQLQILTERCGATLAEPHPPPIHCLAYNMLVAIATPLVNYDEEKISSWTVDENAEKSERPQLSLDWLQPHFSSALELTDIAVSAFTAGVESCSMAPGSDSHGVALGCLLLAAALQRTAALAQRQLAHHYLQVYRDARYVETLLPGALRLLPAPLLAAATAHGHGPMPPNYKHMFHTTPVLDADDPDWRNIAVGWFACYAVTGCLSGAGGGAARSWWGAAGRGSKPLARIVAAYVTAPLVKRHLRALSAPHRLEDTEIRILWAAQEVVAEFTVEERRVELIIKFGPEYPLTLPQVTAPCPRPSVDIAWIPMYIAYQNGTLLNAIKMWTEAINSRVSSFPQCYICYCRLHPATGLLPTVPCHQCRNRFHTPCLHKWFVTSHRASCPLCRTPF